jgi:hypothetical protein
MLVNLISTFPALALNDFELYFSCPLGSAANGRTVPEAAAGAAAELDADVELDAAVEADEELALLVLFDPPHAASATISTAEVSRRVSVFGMANPFSWERP